MRHTTQIELENQYDLVAVKLGVMNPEDVRRLTVTDALVDTGATGLCLPMPLIEQLGLTPIEMRRARTATGVVQKSNLRYWNEQVRCRSPICLRDRLSSSDTWYWNILIFVWI